MTVEELAALVLDHTRAELARRASQAQADAARVEVTAGRVYTRIDRGDGHSMTGYLMVDNRTGEIFGTRGYGRVHPGRRYGTLAGAAAWFWGEYSPRRTGPSS